MPDSYMFDARLHRQGDHRRRRVRARRPDADERLQHPVPDLPGRAVDPRRGVVARRALHDRGHHRELLQRRHVPGGRSTSRRRSSTTTCKAFGLDEPTGLGLPGEEPSAAYSSTPCRRRRKWAADERYTLSYGQGISVNAVQMASVYATIANDGVRVQPTLVAGTYNAAGQYIPATPSPSKRVIQAKTAKELISILQQVPAVDDDGQPAVGQHPRLRDRGQDRHRERVVRRPGETCPAEQPALHPRRRATSAWHRATARRSSSR